MIHNWPFQYYHSLYMIYNGPLRSIYVLIFYLGLLRLQSSIKKGKSLYRDLLCTRNPFYFFIFLRNVLEILKFKVKVGLWACDGKNAKN